MFTQGLRGVIAAIITPIDASGNPDHARLVARARHLLATGCDGLNLLGTTGEATSFSLAQRQAIMHAVADAGLPLDQMMVGTGAASVQDAVALAITAAELGFGAALVLPPFYYKPVTNEGIVRYIGAIVEATAASNLPIFLYNIPGQSGVAYTAELVALLQQTFGTRIGGLKDSSGDIAYAEQIAALLPAIRVFPSNEAVLLRAHAGDFAGCISATANLNSAHCARAYHNGDQVALDIAVSVRALFNGLPLVPGVKAVAARLAQDATLADLMPPLTQLSDAEGAQLWQRFDALPPASWASWAAA